MPLRKRLYKIITRIVRTMDPLTEPLCEAALWALSNLLYFNFDVDIVPGDDPVTALAPAGSDFDQVFSLLSCH